MQEHYYTKKPKSKLRLKRIKAKQLGNELKFYGSSGVFSKEKIDKGSSILIENCIVNDDSHILDLGCGNGVIGIAIKKAHPDCVIFMTDINERAVALAKANAKLNGIEADIVQGDMFEKVKGKFDSILLNPPQTAGKKICYDMIEQSKKHLKKNGFLQIVARHKKGGKELAKKMLYVFGNVKDIAKKSGYRVYISKLKSL